MLRFKAILGIFLLLPFLTSGDDQPSQLEQLKQRGTMVMLTRNGASSYYIGADGDTGPEYSLVSAFANYLGVELEIVVADAFNQLSGLLESHQGELIAANLSRTAERELQFNFGPDYFETTISVVYRRGNKRPGSLTDLVDGKIMILAGSSYEEALIEARKEQPDLEWEPRADVGIEDLLLAVSDGAVDYTLLDSSIYELNIHFYPSVTRAFDLAGSVPHAWAFAGGSDDSLAQEAHSFMLQAKAQNRLQAISETFFTSPDSLDRVGMFRFLEQVRERLPPLLPIFQEVADSYDLDWRLLAAMGYQESHWNPEAKSYTGVRGIMMLTKRTAGQLGVTDRLDPEQSIEGGARYFLQLRKRIPKRIQEPDRSWMALAAYNMGIGHLRDARVLTERRGGNPDHWKDVNENLVLLSQEKWHKDLKYGYARGFEARQFVENIRSYYEILIWMETREHPLLIARR